MKMIKISALLLATSLLLSCNNEYSTVSDGQVSENLNHLDKSGNTPTAPLIMGDAKLATYNISRELDLDEENTKKIESINTDRVNKIVYIYTMYGDSAAAWDAELNKINAWADTEYQKALTEEQYNKLSLKRSELDKLIYKSEDLKIKLDNDEYLIKTKKGKMKGDKDEMKIKTDEYEYEVDEDGSYEYESDSIEIESDEDSYKEKGENYELEIEK